MLTSITFDICLCLLRGYVTDIYKRDPQNTLEIHPDTFAAIKKELKRFIHNYICARRQPSTIS